MLIEEELHIKEYDRGEKYPRFQYFNNDSGDDEGVGSRPQTYRKMEPSPILKHVDSSFTTNEISNLKTEMNERFN